MSRVTKAVLLAAGRGTRLGELTAGFPKAMLEVGGEPIIHGTIAALAAAGIAEFTVVTGHAAAVLEAATGDGSRWGVRVHYRRQGTLDGTARALALARDDVGEDTFFVGWGDIVVEPGNYRRVLAAADEHAGAAIAVNHVDDPFAGAAVYVDDQLAVQRLVEKPARGTSATHWNNAGLMALPAGIWPFIDGLTPSSRGEYELPAAVAAFIEAGQPVRAVPIEGPWFDIGTPESLAAARSWFGSARR